MIEALITDIEIIQSKTGYQEYLSIRKRNGTLDADNLRVIHNHLKLISGPYLLLTESSIESVQADIKPLLLKHIKNISQKLKLLNEMTNIDEIEDNRKRKPMPARITIFLPHDR